MTPRRPTSAARRARRRASSWPPARGTGGGAAELRLRGPVRQPGRRACPTTPEPASDAVTAWSAAARPRASSRRSSIRAGRWPVAQNRMMFSFLDATNVPVAAPDRTVVGRAVRPRRGPGDAGRHRRRHVHLGDRGRASGVYVANVDLPDGRAVGRRVHDRRRRRRARDDPRHVPGPARGARSSASATRRRRRTRRPWPTSTATSSRISTDDEPVDGVLRDVGRRRARRGRAVRRSPSRRRSSAPPTQCGPTLDRLKPIAAAHPDVTFINVEPYQLEDVDGQLQPVLDRTTSCTPGAGDRRVGPAVRAVDLRRRRRRDRHGLVRAHRRRRGAGGGRRARSTRPGALARVSAASSIRIANSVPAVLAIPDRTGSAVAWCSARWPGGNAVAVLELAELEVDELVAVAVAEREGRARRRGPRRRPPTMTPTVDRRRGRDRPVRLVGRARRRRAAARRHRPGSTTTTSDDGEQVPRAAIHRRRQPAAGPGAGAARCVRAGRRRRSAGRCPGPARRSAGRAARGPGAGRCGRSSARSASRGRRSGRPGRRRRRSRRPAPRRPGSSPAASRRS